MICQRQIDGLKLFTGGSKTNLKREFSGEIRPRAKYEAYGGTFYCVVFYYPVMDICISL